MNIRSMDLQVLIPRATDAGHHQQNLNQQPAIAEQQSAAFWQQTSTQRQQQVQKSPSAQGSKVDRRQEKHQGKQHQQEERQPNQDNKLEQMLEEIDPNLGHHIDLLL